MLDARCRCARVIIFYDATGYVWGMIPYHTIPYHTIPYHTIPYVWSNWCGRVGGLKKKAEPQSSLENNKEAERSGKGLRSPKKIFVAQKANGPASPAMSVAQTSDVHDDETSPMIRAPKTLSSSTHSRRAVLLTI